MQLISIKNLSHLSMIVESMGAGDVVGCVNTLRHVNCKLVVIDGASSAPRRRPAAAAAIVAAADRLYKRRGIKCNDNDD